MEARYAERIERVQMQNQNELEVCHHADSDRGAARKGSDSCTS